MAGSALQDGEHRILPHRQCGYLPHYLIHNYHNAHSAGHHDRAHRRRLRHKLHRGAQLPCRPRPAPHPSGRRSCHLHCGPLRRTGEHYLRREYPHSRRPGSSPQLLPQIRGADLRNARGHHGRRIHGALRHDLRCGRSQRSRE